MSLKELALVHIVKVVMWSCSEQILLSMSKLPWSFNDFHWLVDYSFNVEFFIMWLYVLVRRLCLQWGIYNDHVYWLKDYAFNEEFMIISQYVLSGRLCLQCGIYHHHVTICTGWKIMPSIIISQYEIFHVKFMIMWQLILVWRKWIPWWINHDDLTISTGWENMSAIRNSRSCDNKCWLE